MTLKEVCSEIGVWQDWRNRYGQYVPKFIEEAIRGGNWDTWDKEVFNEYFMKSSGQCVSSLRQGYFSGKDKTLIKENWNEVAPVLQKIALNQSEPQFDVYSELARVIRKYTKNDMRAATYRMVAGIQPQLLCTIVNQARLSGLVDYLRSDIEGFKFESKETWFQNSYEILKKFKLALDNQNGFDILTYPWQVYEEFALNRGKTVQNDMSEEGQNQEEDGILDLLRYKKQIILQGPPGTGKTKLAKDLAIGMLGLEGIDGLKENSQFQLIQFHPSYSYEDFVRGIAAKPNKDGGGVLYEAENRLLGAFAKKALDNYKQSQLGKEEMDFEIWFEESFEAFKATVENEVVEHEQLRLTETVGIFDITSNAFLYGTTFRNPGRINFIEFRNIAAAITKGEYDLKNPIPIELSRHAFYRQPYYRSLLNSFFGQYKYVANEPKKSTELKNYVLIIDEINRANLSSVLGELIYALEYRDEDVDSMYAVGEKGNKLRLPSNLYIIGTMNTADRSVGHIDYAIRRRFAFVDVLPKNLESQMGADFKKELFAEVSKLFVKDYNASTDYSNPNLKLERADTLSAEFHPKDVWLGHSYFIQHYEKDASGNPDTSKIDFQMRLNYEIKPILREYVRDGILIDGGGIKVEDFINKLQPDGKADLSA